MKYTEICILISEQKIRVYEYVNYVVGKGKAIPVTGCEGP
jgi:hypothetical protein